MGPGFRRKTRGLFGDRSFDPHSAAPAFHEVTIEPTSSNS